MRSQSELLVVSGATDFDLVCLELEFSDETMDVVGPVKRFEARNVINVLGNGTIPWGPYAKTVKNVVIIEYVFDKNAAPFDTSKPVH